MRLPRLELLLPLAVSFLMCAVSAAKADEPTAKRGDAERAGRPVTARADVTATEIRLGMSAAFSGTARALGIELYRGAMAYFLGINDAGGVNGRRIVIKAYDDGYDPEPAIRNTLTLMNDDDVFALFNYVGTPTMNRALPLLSKFRSKSFFLLFPFTGASTNRIPPYDRFSFNLRPSYAQETQGLVDHFVGINRTRIAVFYQADGYGRAGWAGIRAALDRHGLTIAGEATYKRGARYGDSYDRQVAIMQEVDPDAIICIGAYPACGGFIRDARNRELAVPIGTVSFVGSEFMLKLLAATAREKLDYVDYLVCSQVVPSYNDDSVPLVREYQEGMARYRDKIMPPDDLIYPRGREPKNSYRPLTHSFVSLEGFLNAKLFVEILRRMGPDPHRAAIKSTAMSLHDLDVGLDHRLNFGGPDARRQASDKVYFTVVKDGRFVPFGDRDWQAWAKP